jgi:microcin C transport system substrate-binding protein
VKDATIDSLAALYDKEYDPARRVELIRAMDARLNEISPYALAWYGPFSRIVFWNKFGYPQGYLGRMGNYLAIQSLWYEDPAKKADLDRGLADPSVTLPVGETEDKYWLIKLGKI